MRIEFDSVEKGTTLPELKIGPISQMDLVRYAGASGDFNPIHNDNDFAKSQGLDGTIAHGMLIMGYLGRFCTNWVDQSQIKNFGVKFKSMTKPGETLICSGAVKMKKEVNGEKLVTVAIQAADEKGEVKVSGDLVITC
ncbi:MAG: MaoC family dehydratase [Leptospiraceae bacterium]|nr:MaoC family dehydratase [Leptospiraceae bacterium]MCP5498889.1 MaoC family dehydratase [Leptospiraceae bacterium]